MRGSTRANRRAPKTTLKKLAATSEKGEYFYKLGAMYGDDERWKESREMLRKALQKGGIKRTGEAWMRIAVAEHNLKDTPSAVAALQKAITFDETTQAGQRMVASLERSVGGVYLVAFLSAAEVGGGSRRRARASRSRYSICPLTLRSSEAARRSNCAHTSGGRRSRNAFLPGLANVCRQG